MVETSYVIELEEKVKAYREEIQKKDELVQKLSSMDIAMVPVQTENVQPDETTKAKREELAILRCKVEQLCDKTLSQEAEFNGQKAIIHKLEQTNRELQAQITATGDKNKDLSAVVETLNSKSETATIAKDKAEKRIAELEKLLEEEREKLKAVETRLKHQIVERESSEHEMHKAEERLEYFVTQMIRIFDKYVREDQITSAGWKDEAKLAQLISHASTIVEENLKHRGRIQELTDRIQQKDTELAERERTVHRLGEQITNTTVSDRETRNLVQQLEYSRGNERALDHRVHSLTDELMDAKVRIRELERQLSKAMHDKDHAWDIRHDVNAKENDLFREALAAILSSPRFPCSPTEVAIKEHARRIVSECIEQKELCSRLEARLADVTNRLESIQSHKIDANHQLERVERDNLALRDHIKRLESELATSEVTKDGHHADKERFFLYLCQLASKVKVDQSLAVRMDFQELQEAILVRVGQLTGGEFTLLTDVQANADRIAGLSRQVKRLQDQLSSKEIQLGLWRDKAAKLEEQLAAMNRVKADAQAERANAQKAAAGERRAEVENGRLRDEIHRLRSELLDLNDTKTQFIQTEERLTELLKSNKDLEELRQRQASKIAELREVVEKQAAELTEQQKQSTESVQRLLDDNKSTRATIEQLRRSEKELFEFRALIARLLGLNVDQLSVPNYEIVQRLELLIADKHHHHPIPSEDHNGCLSSQSPSRRVVDYKPDQMIYMAGPGLAKARSKKAWNDSLNSPGDQENCTVTRSMVDAKLRVDGSRKRSKERQYSTSPESLKLDPRRY